MAYKPLSGRTLGTAFIPVEILLHGLAAALVLQIGLATYPATTLYALIACFVAGSSLRFTEFLQVSMRGEDIPPQPDSRLGTLGLLLYGCAWAGVALLSLWYSDHQADLDPYLPAALLIGLLASFIGSGFHSLRFLYIALPATLVPLAWLLKASLWTPAMLWGLLLLIVLVAARASRHLQRSIDRLQLLSQSNTDLVAKLADARDSAISQQKNLESLNQDLQRESQEREAAKNRLRESEQELTRILDDMMDTYFHVDFDGNIRRLSPSIASVLGESFKECIDRNFISFFAESTDFQQFQDTLNKGFGTVRNHEALWRNAEDNDIWVSFNAHFHEDSDGRPDGIEGVARDTTQSREAKENLFREKEWWRVTLESIADGVITTDLDGRIRYLNPVAETKTGWQSEEAQGKLLTEAFWLVEEESRERARLPLDEWLHKGRKATLSNPAVLIHRREDNESVIELSGAPIRDSHDEIIGSVLVFHDVTKMRALATQLAYQATHDSLTGLINRIEFDHRVEQAIHNANQSEKVHALLYIDLDQFKIVNDTCGHHAGDELLRQVTRLLRGGLREADTLARLGGDEFGVLLTGCPLNIAGDIAEKLRKLVEDFRFGWEGKPFRIGASIGVVPITNSVTSLTELLSAADSACYVAKEDGRNRVHIYKPDDEGVMAHHGQMQWMQRIQDAIEKDQFALYSQPITSMDKNTVLYAEVLLRMLDDPCTDQERLIPPNAFMPAAERYHLMPQIDRWVITHALKALASNDSPLGRNAFITINLSGQSLSDLSLYDHVVQELHHSGVAAERICFEITESAVIANMELAQKFVTLLKEKGCKFALDDFGSGLSTFDYLKNLPVDFVKLDGLLVRELNSSRVSQAMVHAINYVTHVMGMKSIAEYVENDAILDTLQKLKVDFAQGYGIAKPELFYKAPRV